MNDVPAPIREVRRITGFGILGLAIALLSLVGAVMSPWAVSQLQGDEKPIDEVAADTAVKIKDRITAKLKGQVYTPPPEVRPQTTNWSRIYPAIVVGAGVLAACIGVVGFVCRHDLRLNATTVGVGVSAILFQYFLLLAGAILLVVLIAVALMSIGASP